MHDTKRKIGVRQPHCHSRPYDVVKNSSGEVRNLGRPNPGHEVYLSAGVLAQKLRIDSGDRSDGFGNRSFILNIKHHLTFGRHTDVRKPS
jgi:hypothetical protein